MKLTAIILLSVSLTASAGGYTQSITLSLKDVPLEKVFAEIKKQTPYTFVYYKEDLSNAVPVDIKVSDASIEAVLKICLARQPLTYTIVNNSIVIKRKPEPVKTPAIASDAEILLDIRGSVANEKGEPVADASVQVKNSRLVTHTDEGGKYELHSVPSNGVLVFSGINIETYETKINGRTEICVAAATKITRLQDVIVNKGYYSTSQRLNTGSVSKITAEDIGQAPVLNPLQILQGRATGIQVTQNSGLPGSNYTVQIRGQNSLRNSSLDYGNYPLYVVDGVPYFSQSLNMAPGPYPAGAGPTAGMSPLNSINPADIESIEVLKDADATSIYGSRGANGVILITTKKGKAGRMIVDVKVYTGIENVARKANLLNTQQYLAMRHEALKNSGVSPLASDYDINGAWDTTRYTDWQKVLIGGTAHTSDANLDISGGNNTTQYRFGGGYHRETTVFPGNYSDQRASAQFSLNAASPNQRFKSSLSINYSFEKNNMIFGDLTATALQLPPDAPALFDSAGNINWQNNTFITAPNVNPMQPTQRPYRNYTNNLIGNALLSYDLGSGLIVKTNLGYTTTTMKELTRRYSTYFPPSQQANFPPQSNFGNANTNSWIIEPQISWHKGIGRGNLNILAGSTFQQQENERTLVNASGFLSPALMDDIAAATQSTITSSYNGFVYKYNAGFGRISFDWDKKYLINLTARRDGSSRFGPNRQFANFGAAGIGWIFSEEGFVQKNLSFLSYGKLRASYGTTGNDQIPNYGFLNTYGTSSPGNYMGNPGLIPFQLYNPDFGWEVNKKLEAALELGFLKDRILLTASYYHNRSSNQLVGYVLPPTTGFTSIQANLPALVQNTGVEIQVNSTNISTKAFTWKTSFNLTIPRNKLVAYPNLALSSYSNTYEVGKPLSISKVYHYIGVSSTTGLYTFDDVNKDGNYTIADRHSEFVGQNFFGGLQNSLRYNGFQLDILFQFVKQSGRGPIFNAQPGGVSNQMASVLSRWQKTGDNAPVQAFGTAYPALLGYSYYAASDGNIVNSSFVRLKNLSLSYQLPATLLRKAKIQSSRIFVQGQNLLTFTSFKGLDPETGNLLLPPLRTLVAGLQITL